jgi:DNA-binding transcriptional LysR family regulator
MLDSLRQADSERAKTITVACSVGVATYWLMPRLSAFYRVHPDLLVNVNTTQSGVPALADGVDVAIRYGHGRWSDGVVHHLFDEVVEPVCAPSLLARFDNAVPPNAVSLLHVRSAETSWTDLAGLPERNGTSRRQGRRPVLHQLRSGDAGRAGRARDDAGLAVDHRRAGRFGRPDLGGSSGSGPERCVLPCAAQQEVR